MRSVLSLLFFYLAAPFYFCTRFLFPLFSLDNKQTGKNNIKVGGPDAKEWLLLQTPRLHPPEQRQIDAEVGDER